MTALETPTANATSACLKRQLRVGSANTRHVHKNLTWYGKVTTLRRLCTAKWRVQHKRNSGGQYILRIKQHGVENLATIHHYKLICSRVEPDGRISRIANIAIFRQRFKFHSLHCITYRYTHVANTHGSKTYPKHNFQFNLYQKLWYQTCW